MSRSKVHLLLGVKNTRIQNVLIRVLSSGGGVYLSPFKDVGVQKLYLLARVKFLLKLTRISRENRTMWFTLFTTQISWETQLIVGLRGVLGLVLKER